MEIVITEPLLRGTGLHRFTPFASTRSASFQEIPPPVGDLPYKILVYSDGLADLMRALRKRRFDTWEWFLLGLAGEELAARPKSDSLIAVDHLAELWREAGVIPYRHQVDAARKVVFEMAGRAILADEVGLGKTIEAGLIAKEYLLRRLARRILILTPASLCRQWQGELREKFDIPAWVARSEWDWQRNDILIASLDTAKSARNRERILAESYDLVIVDEAHKLKNPRTKNWQLINALSAKYLLMLTATPVQNDLKELYNLITLLKPGQLGTFREFQRHYTAGRREPKNESELRSLLRKVMVRNRRSDANVKFTRREVCSELLELTAPERQLYQAVTHHVRSQLQRWRGTVVNVLPLIVLQREVCSSPYAAAVTLDNLRSRATDQVAWQAYDFLLRLALSVPDTAKAVAVDRIVREAKDKVIIFTEYRATQAFLCQRLLASGYAVVPFDGSLSPSRKEWMRYIFQRNAQILVSTESGGEGLNFQFCHHVINYDLPWNPMRLEQRIGRVHRLGQVSDVRVYNLATRDTIEARILQLLYEKVDMFTKVIGEIESLFGTGPSQKNIEQRIIETLIAAEDDEDLGTRLDEIGQEIQSAAVSTEEASRAWWDVL